MSYLPFSLQLQQLNTGFIFIMTVPFVCFVLFFSLTPVLGFNPYSVVDLLNVLSSSGVTCAPSHSTGGGRRVETEITLSCSHCYLKNGYTQQGIPTMILKMVLIIISEIKRLASFALLTVCLFESSIYILQYFCFISILNAALEGEATSRWQQLN